MPSLNKSESARINGAKSRGPKTEAGRRRSSQNALKHGLTAQTLLLPSEDPDEFQQLLTSYIRQFQPVGPAELDLVHEMVAAKWRLQRLAIIETQLYVDSMQRVKEYADHRLSPAESLTQAFERLANSGSYSFLHRAESSLERTYSRALRNLIQLQGLRRSPEPPAAPPPEQNEICKNEPTAPGPLNGHLPLDLAPTPSVASSPHARPGVIDPADPAAQPPPA